jgi:hypothetical protein
MVLNPVQFVVYPLAVLFCWLGRRAAMRWPKSWSIAAVFFALALPALCYDVYYLRVWEEPMWLYEVRSWRGSELLAALAGLLPGWVQGQLRGRWSVSFVPVAILVLLGMSVPYVKQLAGPAPLREKWRDGVCLQSSPSTCGPASVATLLASMGVQTTEAELARDSFSTSTGTENWYLRRAIEKRGVSTRYLWIEPPVQDVPHPAIAGRKLGDRLGHFVAILDSDEKGYTIADPLGGRFNVSKAELAKRTEGFSGFFLVLEAK